MPGRQSGKQRIVQRRGEATAGELPNTLCGRSQDRRPCEDRDSPGRTPGHAVNRESELDHRRLRALLLPLHDHRIDNPDGVVERKGCGASEA